MIPTSVFPVHSSSLISSFPWSSRWGFSVMSTWVFSQLCLELTVKICFVFILFRLIGNWSQLGLSTR